MCIKWTPINVLLILRKLFITDRRTSSIHNPLQSSPKQAYNSLWHIDWGAAQSFVGITFAFNRINYIYMYNYLIPRLNQMIMRKGRFIVKVLSVLVLCVYPILSYWHIWEIKQFSYYACNHKGMQAYRKYMNTICLETELNIKCLLLLGK